MASKTEKDRIDDARKAFARSRDHYAEFFERVTEDYRFRAGDQWPKALKQIREGDPEGPQPCLVMDKTNQYVRQVVNDARQNRPAVRVRPVDSGADKETAEILQGLIRHIEDQSRADIAYETALDAAATCGLGWFRALPTVIDASRNLQEIRIDRLPNTCAVYPDSDWADPDGADLRRVFVVEKISRTEFERLYPKADVDSWEDESGDWLTDDSVTVAEDYQLEETTETRFVLQEGQEMTEQQYWDIYAGDASRPPFVVESRTTRTVRWKKLTCGEILEETTIPCEWIPVIPVIGNEMWVDGKRVLTGMIRSGMDAQRVYNYARSAHITQVALAPKSPYVAAGGQIEPYESEWKDANRRNVAVLRYDPIELNGVMVPKPERQSPPQPSAGWLQEMQIAERDLQAAFGVYNASLGAPSNEKSGKAILARQREGDVSTYHYVDNLARSLRQLGKVLISMIPKVYDTQRIIRILGEDGSPEMVTINPEISTAMRQGRDSAGRKIRIFNPGIGHYDVSVSVGPAYTSKRQEAAEAMVEMTRNNPQLLPLIGDLMIEAMDWPMADRISKRLKTTLPPEIQREESDEADEDARIRQAVEQVAQQFQQQAEAFQQQAMAAMQELQQTNAQLQAENQAIKADREATMIKLGLDAQKLQVEAGKNDIQAFEAETERLQVVSRPPEVEAILRPILEQIEALRQQVAMQTGCAPPM